MSARIHAGASNLPDDAVLAGFVMAVVLSSVGTLLNVITLYTLCTNKKLKQHSTTLYVISLTVSDLVYCAFCLPVTAETFAGCHICQVEILCKLYAFAFYWILSVMLCNQAGVALTRYVSVCHPTNPFIKFNRRNSLILIALTWSLPLLVMLIPLTELWGSLGFDEGTGTCTFISTQHLGSPRKVFLIVGLGIPTVIIILCYVRIYVTYKQSGRRIRLKTLLPPSGAATTEMNSDVRSKPVESGNAVAALPPADPLSDDLPSSPTPSHATRAHPMRRYSMSAVNASFKEKDQRRERQENRMTFTLFVIFLAFVVCTLPPSVILAIDPQATHHPNWHIPLYIFGWCFGVVNPLIYVTLNQSYKEAYKITLKSLWGICRKRDV